MLWSISPLHPRNTNILPFPLQGRGFGHESNTVLLQTIFLPMVITICAMPVPCKTKYNTKDK